MGWQSGELLDTWAKSISSINLSWWENPHEKNETPEHMSDGWQILNMAEDIAGVAVYYSKPIQRVFSREWIIKEACNTILCDCMWKVSWPLYAHSPKILWTGFVSVISKLPTNVIAVTLVDILFTFPFSGVRSDFSFSLCSRFVDCLFSSLLGHVFGVHDYTRTVL